MSRDTEGGDFVRPIKKILMKHRTIYIFLFVIFAKLQALAQAPDTLLPLTVIAYSSDTKKTSTSGVDIGSNAAKALKWGSIDSNYLSMTRYEADTSAAAVILAKQGSMIVSNLGVYYKEHRRIKILKDAALRDLGNLEINIYVHSKAEELRSFRGMVIQPDGTRDTLTNTDFFEEKTNKYINKLKVAFPKLKAGCIIDYFYIKIGQPNYFIPSLYTWYFQEEYPVLRSSLIVNPSDYFEYDYFYKGQDTLKKAPFMEETELHIMSTNLSTNINTHSVVKSYYPSANAAYYYIDSVAAFKRESYMTTSKDHLVQMRFQMTKILSSFGGSVDYITTWQKLADAWAERADIGKLITKSSNHKKVWAAVKPLIENAKTDEEKVKIIYHYISENIAWDDEFRYSAEVEDLDEAFLKKKANSAELNLMLLACLYEAGIKASPCLVSTIDNGVPMEFHPIVTQFNHLVAYVEINGAPQIIDAGNKLRQYNQPRVVTLNKRGWLLDKSRPKWVDIVPPMSGTSILANLRLDTEGVAKGNISAAMIGYDATDARRNYEESGRDNAKLARKYGDIEIDSFDIQNEKDVYASFKERIVGSVKNLGVASGDVIYLKPILGDKNNENPFKVKTRLYPVDFPYPTKNQSVLNITLPEGYVVEELPKNISLILPENGGKLQCAFSIRENVLQIVYKYNINTLHFLPSDYAALQEFFGVMEAKYNEQIVLRKKP